MNEVYTFYANPVVRARSYPESYTIAPEFNLPPDDSYTARLLPLLDAETQGIDVVMFRITDPRPADALIRAVPRGVPVRCTRNRSNTAIRPGGRRVQRRSDVHGRRPHKDARACGSEPSENGPAGRSAHDNLRHVQLVDGVR